MASAHKLHVLLRLGTRAVASGFKLSTVQSPGLRTYRTSAVLLKRRGRSFFDARDPDHEEKEKQLIVRQGDVFDEAGKKAKNKATFHEACNRYMKKENVYRRGSVEFIYAAMDYMDQFGVHRDRDTYKKLLCIFPKHKMVAKTLVQAEFQHYPKQQQCIIDLLEKMETNGIVPDDELGYMIVDRFGDQAHCFRKYQRMMYWMPKFKNMNPWPIPWELPESRLELAKMALRRMAVDLENKLSVFETSDLEAAADDTFVVSAMSPAQVELTAALDTEKPVFVDGGFSVWLRSEELTYYVLKADATETCRRYHENQENPPQEEPETWFTWDPYFSDDRSPSHVVVKPTLHEQEDGTILAMCITGTGSEDSLRSWLTFLQRANPRLSETPVVFRLTQQKAGLEEYSDTQQKQRDKEASQQS